MHTAESVKALARSLGADLAGIAAAEAFTDAPPALRPSAVLPSARSVVVLGGAFPPEILDAEPPEYTALRNSTAAKMTRMAKDLAARLTEAGFEAAPVDALAVKGVVDGRYAGPLSLKHAAALAGLGYIGNNTLLITPELGNMVWLSAVVTSAPLEADKPSAGRCPEDCGKCVSACPVQALGSPAMDQNKCRARAFPVVDGKVEIRCWNCRSVCPDALGTTR